MALPVIQFDFGVFGLGNDPVMDEKGLLRLLETGVWFNRNYLDANPLTPKLYVSGVRYVRDPDGVEHWKGIGACLRDGVCDCKSLAAWRVSELRQAGEDATFVLRRLIKPDLVLPKINVLYHIQIQRQDWAVEDPSAILGMKDPWEEAING